MSQRMFNSVNEFYFFRNVSLVPLIGEINSEEGEKLWLEEKRLWILGQGEDSTDSGKGESLDVPKPMMTEFESKERKGERPARLFQHVYTRKNKDVNAIPPLGSSTSLNDTTMLSDDSSETNPKVHVPSPLTSGTIALNPQVDDQGRRYLLHDRKYHCGRKKTQHSTIFS